MHFKRDSSVWNCITEAMPEMDISVRQIHGHLAERLSAARMPTDWFACQRIGSHATPSLKVERSPFFANRSLGRFLVVAPSEAMRIVLICCAFGLLAFASVAAKDPSLELKDAPASDFRLVMDVPVGGDGDIHLSRTVNLGELDPTDSGTVVMHLINQTKRTWEITRAESTCSCTVVEVTSGTVEPGQKITVRTKLSPRSQSMQIDQYATVTLFDSRANPFTIQMRYRLKNWVAFTQGTHALRMVGSNEARQPFELQFFVTPPRRPSQVEVVSRDNVHFSDIRPIRGVPHKYSVTGFVQPSQEKIRDSCLVTLNQDGQVLSEAIVMFAMVRPVRITPRTLRFLPEKDSASRLEANCILVIEGKSSNPADRAATVDFPDQATVTASYQGRRLRTKCTPLAKGRFRVKLSVSSDVLTEKSQEPVAEDEKMIVFDVVAGSVSDRLEAPISLIQSRLLSVP